MANGIDNDNGNDNDNDNDGTSDIMQHHTIPSAPKPKPPTPRRQQSHSHSQRVDMTGQLASASVSTPDLEDFTSMFHKVLEEQGYAELTLQQQREGGSQSAASDAESTQIFNYHDGVGDGDGDFARQSAALVATEDRNNHNYNYKHKPSPARKASHNSATGAPASNRTRAPVGVSPKRSTSTSTSSPGRSPGSTSSSAARLAEKKRRVHEMRRLNRTIGDLNESLRERGDNSQSPRRSRSLTESRGASRPPGSTALLPKTIADVAPEAPGTTAAAAAAAAAARTTTAPTTTIYETRNNGACREVVSGLPITVEHRDDKRQVSSAALLDTTTSTFSSEDGEKGGFFPTEISSLHTLCRAGVIVFAVLGIVALGIYLGYMSYMIRANNQS